MPQSATVHYRYERKYLSGDYSAKQLENFLLLNEQSFQKIYYKRQVNSIYFDTPDFEYFQQNINGDAQRQKVRVRWYGLADYSEQVQLEVKIRSGEMIRKEIYPLVNPKKKLSDWLEELTLLVQAKLSEKMEEARALQPVLNNVYQRAYYYSPATKVRITIDERIGARQMGDYLKLRPWHFFDFSVLECKYKMQDDEALRKIVRTMPIQIAKSSKYVMGVEKIYPQLCS